MKTINFAKITEQTHAIFIHKYSFLFTCLYVYLNDKSGLCEHLNTAQHFSLTSTQTRSCDVSS